MFNVSQLTQPAQSIVQAATQVYLNHTQAWFIGLIAHGSAVKGGFIPGCSDIDLQLYLENAAFSEYGLLPLSISMAIQRDLSHIDPTPFQYIQCYALPPRPQQGFVGPIPGAYQIIAGTLPVPQATTDQLYESARKAMLVLNPTLPYIHTSLLEHRGGRLAQQVRFVCTDVWPVLYHVLTLQHPDPIHIWGLPKAQAIDLLPPNTTIGQVIRAFYRAVLTYYAGEQTVEQALTVFESAITFLGEAKANFNNLQ
jgi:hypothetical protein